jgi:prephenate dehydrogenase
MTAKPNINTPMFNRVALIGIGLIGSSLSHAIRRGGNASDGPAHRTDQQSL